MERPVGLSIKKNGLTKSYKVVVHAFSGLPVLRIETEGRKDVVTKKFYTKAHIRLEDSLSAYLGPPAFEDDVEIKVRGNHTATLEKKPFRLKFENKVSLLEEPMDKSWVLLANFMDKTQLRNAIAFYMGSLSDLDYTSSFHFVDVILNGRYHGTYMLCDKIKISKNRVNVGDDGFLLEIDTRAPQESDSRYFSTPHIPAINIKDPEVEYGDDKYLYAKNYCNMVDSVLYSDGSFDKNTGWRSYMDMDSFVDWYLINEISKNADGCFLTSCFMNLEYGGKLKMGPIWDFDIAFSNYVFHYNAFDGLYIKEASWYSRLYEDPGFVKKVISRFNFFYDNRDKILGFVDRYSNYIVRSVIEDNLRWGVLIDPNDEKYSEEEVRNSYKKEVDYLKDWIEKRFDWLKTEFDNINENSFN